MVRTSNQFTPMKLLALTLAAVLPAAIVAPAQAQHYGMHPDYGMHPGYGIDPGYVIDPGFAPHPGYGTDMTVGNIIDSVLAPIAGYPEIRPLYPNVSQRRCHALHARGQFAAINGARFQISPAYSPKVTKTWVDGSHCRSAAVGYVGQWHTIQAGWSPVSTRFDLRHGNLVETRNGRKLIYSPVYRMW